MACGVNLSCCTDCFAFTQIKVWSSNPHQFVEDEDDDTLSYTVRISAQDLLLVGQYSVLHKQKESVFLLLMNLNSRLQAVAAEFQNESAAALAAAATRHLQEAEQAKNSGNQHWSASCFCSLTVINIGIFLDHLGLCGSHFCLTFLGFWVRIPALFLNR